MTWQTKGTRMAMGQFVRVKSERMVLVRFEGEPKEAAGKAFDGSPQEQLHFPVTFWDERSIADRYAEGEAVRLVMANKGDAKLFSVSGGPLLRELLAEDREESVIGRTFIVSHIGTSRETVYKFREVKIQKQSRIAVHEDEEEAPVNDDSPAAIPDVEDQEAKAKVKFNEEVTKRTTKRKTKKVEESPAIVTAVTSDAQ